MTQTDNDIDDQPQQVSLRIPRAEVRATWILLWANVGIYVLTCLLSGNLFQPASSVLALGWKQNDLIASGEYWRLLTAMFLHGNLVHIFFNSYALFALGPECERFYGTFRFTVVYFVAGLAGSVASYLFTAGPSVGASGAVFGLIGALGAFYGLNRKTLGAAGQMALQNIGGVIFINLLIGFAGGGFIDNFAHLGGLICGAAAGAALGPRLNVDTRLYPPVLVQDRPGWGWGAIGALVFILAAIVVLLPGAGYLRYGWPSPRRGRGTLLSLACERPRVRA
ncbi:rhomboid family intramembrane serine protease [Candidatus Gracilibacteria bacterium]|nr:rhomboid family intramembrane serine protease [Candidatus Gracilibacteria bacterium]